jgi:hypothetical protein
MKEGEIEIFGAYKTLADLSIDLRFANNESELRKIENRARNLVRKGGDPLFSYKNSNGKLIGPALYAAIEVRLHDLAHFFMDTVGIDNNLHALPQLASSDEPNSQMIKRLVAMRRKLKFTVLYHAIDLCIKLYQKNAGSEQTNIQIILEISKAASQKKYGQKSNLDKLAEIIHILINKINPVAEKITSKRC